MRRFPDFSRFVTRGLLAVLLAVFGAAVMWSARTATHAVTASARPASEEALDPGGGGLAPARSAIEGDALEAAARAAWESYVPAEIRAQYEPPSTERIRELLVRLEAELHDGSGVRLARYERDARRALKVLRRSEGGEMLAAWLEPRLDMIRAAAHLESPPAPETSPAPSHDSQLLPLAPAQPEGLRPQYTREYWDRVLDRRRPPRRAADLVPRLKEVFAAHGVPPELVWIAEVESSMNPEATSPVGARGLFQFMPLTAARFGLETGLMLDERTDPEKSARAAAAYLRILHRRFQSWPLALAAYNAGEGRVGRALSQEQAKTFEDVAHRLPLETRMYVPKVLATVAARESVDPVLLPSPAADLASRAARVRRTQASPFERMVRPAGSIPSL